MYIMYIYIYIHMFITDSGFENHLASLGVSPFSGTKPILRWDCGPQMSMKRARTSETAV